MRPKVIPSYLYDDKYFLTDCEGYVQFKSNHGLSERLQSFVDEIEASEKDANILDLGCGRGEVVYELSKKARLVIGIDYSKDAIALARNRYKKKNVRFRQADVKKLPFSNNFFDLIVSSELLEHLHSWEQNTMFREIRRVLKPKGRIVIQTEPNKMHRYLSSIFSLPIRIYDCLRTKEKLSLLIKRPYMHTVMHVNELTYFQAKRLAEKYFNQYTIKTKEMILNYNKPYLRFFFNLYPLNNIPIIGNLINREIIIKAVKT